MMYGLVKFLAGIQVYKKYGLWTVHYRFLVPGSTQKFLRRFDNSFDIKIYAIDIIFKSHKPFQSCQLKVS